MPRRERSIERLLEGLGRLPGIGPKLEKGFGRLIGRDGDGAATAESLADISRMNGESKRFGPVPGHLKRNLSKLERLDQVPTSSD